MTHQNQQERERSLENLPVEQQRNLTAPPMTEADVQQLRKVASTVKVMAGCVIAALIMVALYVGKDILIPLALAVLLGFLLDPLVTWLKKKGLPRIAAILLVMLATLGVLGGGATYLGIQLGELSQKLPEYQDTIKQKLNSVKEYASGPSVWDGAKSTFNTVESSIATTVDEPEEKGVQEVKIVGTEATAKEEALQWLSKIADPLATFGIVLLFLILILLDRKDLHDRLLKLLGGNLNVGTDVLDEAAVRIGTYLRMQLIVNVTYGIPMALGLWLIGVPAAIMWGILAVAMRFVPYVGPMLCAVCPLVLAFAVDPTWNMVLWTLALIVTLELISNNIIEPWLYGESTGLSTLAIIVAATFWTALWGPVGLILSTPLTACILVLAHYIPALGFLKVLLGSAPVLTAPERFYQRLVANDVNEALDFAVANIQQNLPKKATDEQIARQVNTFYTEVAIPALVLFSRGYNQEATAEHRLNMHQSLRLFNHDIQQHYTSTEQFQQQALSPWVYCLGARWEVDLQASMMLSHNLQLQHIPAQASSEVFMQPRVDVLDEVPNSVKIICLSLFHVQPLAQIRLICHRIRQRFPDVHLIVATWNSDADALREQVMQRFAVDAVVDNVKELTLMVDALLLKDGVIERRDLTPEQEQKRLEVLDSLDLLNAENLPIYQDQIEQTLQAFDVKYAQVSWVGQDWVNTPATALTQDFDAPMTLKLPREESICTHVVYENQALIIEDLDRDPRFADHPDLKKHHIRFYAGVPLKTKQDIVLGSLCIMDHQPREMREDDLTLLNDLATELMITLTDPKKNELKRAELQRLNGVVSEA